MQKWLFITFLVLLSANVSAQEITGYIGLNVITPAQSVDATAAVQVDNASTQELPAAALDNFPEAATNLQGNKEADAQNVLEAPARVSFLQRILNWLFG
jgi:hypothetical protein